MIERLAPAKLNLALVVGPTRPDGRHEVATVLQRISLADRIRLEPSPELRVEGFAEDTIVRSALQADHHIERVALGRQHQHGNAAVLADLTAYLQSVEEREHDVQDHQVELIATGAKESLPSVGGRRHPVPRLAEAERGDLSDGGVVLHDEQRFVHVRDKGTAGPPRDEGSGSDCEARPPGRT